MDVVAREAKIIVGASTVRVEHPDFLAVLDGSGSVRVTGAADADESRVRWYTDRIRLLMQGRYSLHADALRVDGHLVLLTGRPNTGKTTLVRALALTPDDRLAMDLAPVAIADDGAWLESIEGVRHPQPIDVVIDLALGGPDEAAVRADELRGLDKIEPLVMAGNVIVIADHGDRAVPFRTWVTGLAAAVRMHRITRPPVGDTREEVAAIVRRLVATASNSDPVGA